MRILIIEDDEKLCCLLQFQFEKEGFFADTCTDGLDAPYYLYHNQYDLILLDRMLPHKDGISLLKDFRRKGYRTPVILLTALGQLEDRITGLDSGADDYIVKPFAFEELLARIRCISRRPPVYQEDDSFTADSLSYFPQKNLLTGPAASCTLSKKEGELLEMFLRNQDRTLSRSQILSYVWGADAEIEDGNLDNYIYFLRRRFHTIGTQAQIKTIRKIGYQFMTGK